MYLQVGLTAEEIGKALGVSRHLVLRTAHDEGFPVRVGGPPPAAGPAEIELINALYADPQVRRALRRHGLPRVPPGGSIWERFPVALPLNAETARDVYVSCGLGIQHIELLTGQPSESVRRLLVWQRDHSARCRGPVAFSAAMAGQAGHGQGGPVTCGCQMMP